MNNNGVTNRVPNNSVSERETVKSLLTQLASQFATIVRGEIALAVQSLREKLSNLRTAMILLAIAIFVGFAAFIILCAAVVIKLSQIMPAAGAAGLVGAILIAVSLLLAYFGYKKIKSSVQ